MPAMDYQTKMLIAFGLVFLFRYLRTIASIYTFVTAKPKPIMARPRYTSDDVSVIVPTTFRSSVELSECLSNILRCSPAALYVVTSFANVSLIEAMCRLKHWDTVQVLGVERLNKRVQMLRALDEVTTGIVVFADDDVFWPENYLNYLLAIFEDDKTGAGGTRQRVRRNPGRLTSMWNFLGCCYLERRVWRDLNTNAVDGSLSTLSGRTAAYRSRILQDPQFRHYFLNDTYRGRPLNSDDDKCLTRYLFSRGWSITIQTDPRSCLYTTLEDSSKFLAQCVRWVRASRRGNATVRENETYWRSAKYWYGCYAIYVAAYQQPALLFDGLLFGLLVSAVGGTAFAGLAYTLLACWILFTKVVKIIPHFLRYPQDLLWLPVMIAFSYAHGIILAYSYATLTNTAWGSQNLDALNDARANDAEVVPLLKSAMDEGESFPTPPRRLMKGDDYFSAVPALEEV